MRALLLVPPAAPALGHLVGARIAALAARLLFAHGSLAGAHGFLAGSHSPKPAAVHHGTISYWQAIVLGLIQGVTELFPVSSLGHTVILPELFGWKHVVVAESQPESFWLPFVVGLHVGTGSRSSYTSCLHDLFRLSLSERRPKAPRRT